MAGFSTLPPKTPIIRDMLFAYDAAVSTHTQREMEQGIRTDYNSKEDKRKNMKNTETAPNIKYKYDLHVVYQLACLGPVA